MMAEQPGAMAFLSLSRAPQLYTRDILQTAHPLAWAPLRLLSHTAYLVRTEGKNVFAWVLAVSTGRLLPAGGRKTGRTEQCRDASWGSSPALPPTVSLCDLKLSLPFSGPDSPDAKAPTTQR